MVATNWWMSGNQWLCEKANEHFEDWLKSKAGKKWLSRKSKNRGSPYYHGYSQPDWMEDAKKCLGENDEEGFKYIKLVKMSYL